MPDLRPSILPALRAFGLPATVTLPGEEPVATTAIWLAPVAVDTPGVLSATNTPQPVLSVPFAGLPLAPEVFALPLSRVSALLRGTIIEVAQTLGGVVLPWTIEAVMDILADEMRVLVIPSEPSLWGS